MTTTTTSSRPNAALISSKLSVDNAVTCGIDGCRARSQNTVGRMFCACAHRTALFIVHCQFRRCTSDDNVKKVKFNVALNKSSSGRVRPICGSVRDSTFTQDALTYLRCSGNASNSSKQSGCDCGWLLDFYVLSSRRQPPAPEGSNDQ